MRIVVVNNFYPPRVGGSSHLSAALARGYVRRGHEVLVITAAFQDAPETETRDGVRIVRLPAFMFPETRLSVSFDISFVTRPSLGRKLRRLLDEFNPDIIHQHGQFMDLTWATGRYARSRSVPTVLSIHTRLENPAARYRNVFGLLDRFVVRPQLGWFRPRLVVMDVLMDEYIDRRYGGAHSGKMAIPVGVDAEWIRGGDPAEGRRLLGVERSDPLILSVGHVIPLRDRVGLVEALPAVLEEYPDAKLAVVGRVYYSLYQDRAEQLGVSHALLNIGPVGKDSIPHLLAAADVECHEQGDGLGTATLEAMAAGVPVVGWGRNDNFPSVYLAEGEDVLLAPRHDVDGLASRLLQVLESPPMAKAMGKKAASVVEEHFDIERVIDRHLHYFKDMVNGEDSVVIGERV